MSGTAFTRLLRWLDDGADSQGERYLEMRRRLVAYFDRRNRPAPDVLADETFDRVSRTLEESGRIKVTPPARYCYVVARFVLLEDIRKSRRDVPFEETRAAGQHARSGAPATDTIDQSLDCLGRCLEILKPEDRDLIVEYYRDAKRQRIDRRRDLAARAGHHDERTRHPRVAAEGQPGTLRRRLPEASVKDFVGRNSYPEEGLFRDRTPMSHPRESLHDDQLIDYLLGLSARRRG